MNFENKTILEKAKETKWIHWLERPYSPFIASLLFAGVGRKYYEKDGLNSFDYSALYQNKIIYYGEEKMKLNREMIKPFLQEKDIFDISKLLNKLHKTNTAKLKELIKSKITTEEKLLQAGEIFREYTSFLWITPLLEEYYDERNRIELPKYIKGDIKEFIATTCIPKKKAAYEKMQDDLIHGISAEKVQRKYSWIKSRDGFTDFYTLDEIKEIGKNAKEKIMSQKMAVPKQAKKLVEELRELIFHRTDRTDKFYEALGIARPIFNEVAKSIGVQFKELSHYDADSIIKGEPKKYSENFYYLFIDGEQILQEGVFLNIARSSSKEIKGIIAQRGIVRGTVKIVKHSSETGKVNEGDILVSQMTLPSFMIAMNKAIAFVTDEGSITCHAAIIAREMKKPCIIGTKIATHVLKDGDLVEVDANTGIVKILDK